MRDGLHCKPHCDPGFHLRDHRRQCDGNCHSGGHGYPCQIRPQEQYSPRHPQLCYGDIFDHVCNPGKRSGLRENNQLDQTIFFPTEYLTIIVGLSNLFAWFFLLCNAQCMYRFFIACILYIVISKIMDSGRRLGWRVSGAKNANLALP
jgi:hypothetical protein